MSLSLLGNFSPFSFLFLLSFILIFIAHERLTIFFQSFPHHLFKVAKFCPLTSFFFFPPSLFQHLSGVHLPAMNIISHETP